MDDGITLHTAHCYFLLVNNLCNSIAKRQQMFTGLHLIPDLNFMFFIARQYNFQEQLDQGCINNQITNMKEAAQLQKQRKKRIDAQTMGFTCFLVYFVVKAIVILLLYKYDNLLKRQPIFIIPFGFLLVVNSYLMLTAGKDPGFQKSNAEENQLFLYQRNQHTFCSICNCRRKNRSKHCHYCGKCVRKFDHHCPWIGSCVGEKNHFKFWLSLLTHTILACFTAKVLYTSMGYYTYQQADGSFSPEFGAFAVFTFFMLCYMVFASSLLILHSYLIAANITTRELMSRNRCHYLKDVRGNPFSKGLLSNLKESIFVIEEGRQTIDYIREWIVEQQGSEEKPRTWLQVLWENEYYSCC